MTRALVVEQPGALLTVQDLGRPGLAALGVPESGALDPAALRLANRLVGNTEDAAGLELTLGGASLRARGALVVSVTGAPVPLSVGGRALGPGVAVHLADGALLDVGRPTVGLRSYLAVRGGIADHDQLGSASTDLLSGLGAALEAGDELRVGPPPHAEVPALDHVATRVTDAQVIRLRVVLGPRDDWFADEAVVRFTSTDWTVGSRSNRIGLRLEGPTLDRAVDNELASEGTVTGSVQVAAGGTPTLFLADHPVTGGYPVIAVVVTEDLHLAAQAAPGTVVRFRPTAAPDLGRESR